MAAPATAIDVSQNRVSSSHPLAAAPERNLDLLRAIAVLLVVICHLFGTSEWTRRIPLPHELGSAGVLIFFVHTSLVLMLSMERMKSPSAISFVWKFYLRRFFRIYPLSILSVVLVFLLRVPEQALVPFQNPSRLEWISNVLLIQNLARTRSAISPLWSLPWEVQMYIALPFIFMGLNSIRRRALMVVLASIVAGLLFLSNWNVVLKLLNFTPCFLGGVLAYVLLRRSHSLPAKFWPAALLLLLSAFLAYRLSNPSGEHAAWMMCTAIGIAIPQFRDLPDGWLAKTAHCIAKYSYGIYLAHVPAIWLAFVRLGPLSFAASFAIFLVVLAGLAFAAYHLIETPMIGFGKRLSAS